MELVLDTFIPREYQRNLFDAIINKGYKKAIAIWPRRAGKDIVCFNILYRLALQRVGNYFYCLPTNEQARKVIWNSITKDGRRILDFIPPELVVKRHIQEMRIDLVNGSTIQLMGSDNYNRLVGTAPKGIIFSEWALCVKQAYSFLEPALNESDGVAIFITTPRAKNHAYDTFRMAQDNPDIWFSERLTIDETKHLSKENIEAAIARGEYSYDHAQQEYYCSFSAGVEGAYYGRYVDAMIQQNRITSVPWEPSHNVNTAWDLGVSDSTVILFYQCIGNQVRIIDYYENHSEGLEHYAKIVKEKPYVYGHHFAPHDIKVRELGTGISRIDKARTLGLSFEIAPNVPVIDGIESVRSMLPRTWIDKDMCPHLVKAIESYRREYDPKTNTYRDKPVHDRFSHANDALRYLALSLARSHDDISPEELEEIRLRAIRKRQSMFPY